MDETDGSREKGPIRSSAANPRPRRSTAGSIQRSLALRLCEEDDHAVMDQVIYGTGNQFSTGVKWSLAPV